MERVEPGERVAAELGASQLGAPDLSDIGGRGREEQYFVDYVSDPSQFGNNVMPRFEQLGEENLRAVAAFLVASKGGE